MFSPGLGGAATLSVTLRGVAAPEGAVFGGRLLLADATEGRRIEVAADGSGVRSALWKYAALNGLELAYSGPFQDASGGAEYPRRFCELGKAQGWRPATLWELAGFLQAGTTATLSSPGPLNWATELSLPQNQSDDDATRRRIRGTYFLDAHGRNSPLALAPSASDDSQLALKQNNPQARAACVRPIDSNYKKRETPPGFTASGFDASYDSGGAVGTLSMSLWRYESYSTKRTAADDSVSVYVRGLAENPNGLAVSLVGSGILTPLTKADAALGAASGAVEVAVYAKAAFRSLLGQTVWVGVLDSGAARFASATVRSGIPAAKDLAFAREVAPPTLADELSAGTTLVAVTIGLAKQSGGAVGSLSLSFKTPPGVEVSIAALSQSEHHAAAWVSNLTAFIQGSRTLSPKITLRASLSFGKSREFVYALALRIAPETSGGVSFGNFGILPGVETVAATDGGASATLRYYGIRRGLRMMVATGGLPSSHAGALCESGGGGWRLPGLAEAAGLSGDGASATLSGSGPAGWTDGAVVRLGALADADAAALSLTLWIDSAGDGSRLAVARNENDSDVESLLDSTTARVACVLPEASYAPLAALATVGFEGAGSRTAAADLGGAAVATVTAVLHHNGAASPDAVSLAALSLSAPAEMTLVALENESDRPGLAVAVVSVRSFEKLLSGLPAHSEATVHARTALGWEDSVALRLDWRYSSSLAATLSGASGLAFGEIVIPSGGRAAIALPDGGRAYARDYGTRRGARVVLSDGAVAAEFAESFCAASGSAEWRLPHIAEAAGLALADDFAEARTTVVSDSDSSPAGWSDDSEAPSRMTLLASGANDASPVSVLIWTSDAAQDSDSRVALIRQDASSDTVIARSGSSALNVRAACVRVESETPPLLGAEIFGGSGRTVYVSVSASRGPVLTVTVRGYRNTDSGPLYPRSGSLAVSVAVPAGYDFAVNGSDFRKQAVISGTDFGLAIRSGGVSALFTIHASSGGGAVSREVWRASLSFSESFAEAAGVARFGNVLLATVGESFDASSSVSFEYLGQLRRVYAIASDDEVDSESGRALCESGGWRLPGLAEAVGLQSEVAVRLSRADGLTLAGWPGSESLEVSPPSRRAGDDATAPVLASLRIPLALRGSDGVGVYLSSPEDSDWKLETDSDSSGLVCVRSVSDDYAPPSLLAGSAFLLDGNLMNADSALMFSAGVARALTVRGWQYAADGGMSFVDAAPEVSLAVDSPWRATISYDDSSAVISVWPPSDDSSAREDVHSAHARTGLGFAVRQPLRLIVGGERTQFGAGVIRFGTVNANAAYDVFAQGESLRVSLIYGKLNGLEVAYSASSKNSSSVRNYPAELCRLGASQGWRLPSLPEVAALLAEGETARIVEAEAVRIPGLPAGGVIGLPPNLSGRENGETAGHRTWRALKDSALFSDVRTERLTSLRRSAGGNLSALSSAARLVCVRSAAGYAKPPSPSEAQESDGVRGSLFASYSGAGAVHRLTADLRRRALLPDGFGGVTVGLAGNSAPDAGLRVSVVLPSANPNGLRVEMVSIHVDAVIASLNGFPPESSSRVELTFHADNGAVVGGDAIVSVIVSRTHYADVVWELTLRAESLAAAFNGSGLSRVGDIVSALDGTRLAYAGRRRGLHVLHRRDGSDVSASSAGALCASSEGWRLPTVLEAAGLLSDSSLLALGGSRDLAGWSAGVLLSPLSSQSGDWVGLTGAGGVGAWVGAYDSNGSLARVKASGGKVLEDDSPQSTARAVCVLPTGPDYETKRLAASTLEVPSAATVALSSLTVSARGRRYDYFGELVESSGAFDFALDAPSGYALSSSDNAASVYVSDAAIAKLAGRFPTLTIAASPPIGLTLHATLTADASALFAMETTDGRPRLAGLRVSVGDVVEVDAGEAGALSFRYGGKLRGLHYALATLAVRPDFYRESICAALGAGWRLPGLVEAAGLLWPKDAANANVFSINKTNAADAAGLDNRDAVSSANAAAREADDDNPVDAESVATNRHGPDGARMWAALSRGGPNESGPQVLPSYDLVRPQGRRVGAVACVYESENYAAPLEIAELRLTSPNLESDLSIHFESSGLEFAFYVGGAGAVVEARAELFAEDSSGVRRPIGLGSLASATVDAMAEVLSSDGGTLRMKVFAIGDDVSPSGVLEFKWRNVFLRYPFRIRLAAAERRFAGVPLFRPDDSGLAELPDGRLATIRYLGKRRGLRMVAGSAADLCAADSFWRAPTFTEAAGLLSDAARITLGGASMLPGWAAGESFAAPPTDAKDAPPPSGPVWTSEILPLGAAMKADVIRGLAADDSARLRATALCVTPSPDYSPPPLIAETRTVDDAAPDQKVNDAPPNQKLSATVGMESIALATLTLEALWNGAALSQTVSAALIAPDGFALSVSGGADGRLTATVILAEPIKMKAFGLHPTVTVLSSSPPWAHAAHPLRLSLSPNSTLAYALDYPRFGGAWFSGPGSALTVDSISPRAFATLAYYGRYRGLEIAAGVGDASTGDLFGDSPFLKRPGRMDDFCRAHGWRTPVFSEVLGLLAQPEWTTWPVGFPTGAQISKARAQPDVFKVDGVAGISPLHLPHRTTPLLPATRADDTTDNARFFADGSLFGDYLWTGLHASDGRPLNIRVSGTLALEKAGVALHRARLLCVRSATGAATPPNLAGVEWRTDGAAVGDGFAATIRFAFNEDGEKRFLSLRYFHYDSGGKRAYEARAFEMKVVSGVTAFAKVDDDGGVVSFHAPENDGEKLTVKIRHRAGAPYHLDAYDLTVELIRGAHDSTRLGPLLLLLNTTSADGVKALADGVSASMIFAKAGETTVAYSANAILDSSDADYRRLVCDAGAEQGWRLPTLPEAAALLGASGVATMALTESDAAPDLRSGDAFGVPSAFGNAGLAALRGATVFADFHAGAGAAAILLRPDGSVDAQGASAPARGRIACVRSGASSHPSPSHRSGDGLGPAWLAAGAFATVTISYVRKGFGGATTTATDAGVSVSVSPPNPNSHRLSWATLTVPAERVGSEARIEFSAQPSDAEVLHLQTATVLVNRFPYATRILTVPIRRRNDLRMVQADGRKVAMRFPGVRRGLRFGVSEERFDSSGAETICAAIGAAWRTPNVAEAAGILSDVNLTLAGRAGPPGWASGVSIPLVDLGPSDSDSDSATTTAQSAWTSARFQNGERAGIRKTEGEVWPLSSLSDSARAVCVSPEQADYVSPPRLRGLVGTAGESELVQGSEIQISLVARADDVKMSLAFSVALADDENGGTVLISLSASDGWRWENHDGTTMLALDVQAALTTGYLARATVVFSPKFGGAAIAAVAADLSSLAIRYPPTGGAYLPTGRSRELEGATYVFLGLRRELFALSVSGANDSDVCGAAGPGWRLPGATEAAGMLSDERLAYLESAAGLSAAGYSGGAAVPGFGSSQALFFAREKQADDFSLPQSTTPLIRLGLWGPNGSAAWLAQTRDDDFGVALPPLPSQGSRIYFCVRDTPGYSTPLDPSGVRYEIRSGGVAPGELFYGREITLTFSGAGGFADVSVSGWRLNAAGATTGLRHERLGLSAEELNSEIASATALDDARIRISLRSAFSGETDAAELKTRTGGGTRPGRPVKALVRVTIAPGARFGGRDLSAGKAFRGLRYSGVRRGLHILLSDDDALNGSESAQACADGSLAGWSWRPPSAAEAAGILSSSERVDWPGVSSIRPKVRASADAPSLKATLWTNDYLSAHRLGNSFTVGDAAHFINNRDRALSFAKLTLAALGLNDSGMLSASFGPARTACVSEVDSDSYSSPTMLSEIWAEAGPSSFSFAPTTSGGVIATIKFETVRADANRTRAPLEPIRASLAAPPSGYALQFRGNYRTPGILTALVSVPDFSQLLRANGDRLGVTVSARPEFGPPTEVVFHPTLEITPVLSAAGFARFGNVLLTAQGQTVSINEREYVYRGRRRGLHMMTSGDVAREGAEAACESGGGWRLASLAELLGLLHDGETHDALPLTAHEIYRAGIPGLAGLSPGAARIRLAPPHPLDTAGTAPPAFGGYFVELRPGPEQGGDFGAPLLYHRAGVLSSRIGELACARPVSPKSYRAPAEVSGVEWRYADAEVASGSEVNADFSPPDFAPRRLTVRRFRWGADRAKVYSSPEFSSTHPRWISFSEIDGGVEVVIHPPTGPGAAVRATLLAVDGAGVTNTLTLILPRAYGTR